MIKITTNNEVNFSKIFEIFPKDEAMVKFREEYLKLNRQEDEIIEKVQNIKESSLIHHSKALLQSFYFEISRKINTLKIDRLKLEINLLRYLASTYKNYLPEKELIDTINAER